MAPSVGNPRGGVVPRGTMPTCDRDSDGLKGLQKAMSAVLELEAKDKMSPEAFQNKSKKQDYKRKAVRDFFGKQYATYGARCFQRNSE